MRSCDVRSPSLLLTKTTEASGVPSETASREHRGEGILIIAPEDFRDEEFLKPKELFERLGATS